MWTSAIRAVRLRPIHQGLPKRTRLNGSRFNSSGPAGHKTYFQEPPPPPPPKAKSGFLSSTLKVFVGIGIGGYLYSSMVDIALPDALEDIQKALMEEVQSGAVNKQLWGVMTDHLDNIRNEPVDYEMCHHLLMAKSGFSTATRSMTHFAKLPSNYPCEDVYNPGMAFSEVPVDRPNGPPRPEQLWYYWGIFDGHAGPQTSNMLSEMMFQVLIDYMSVDGCFKRPYKPNDTHIINTIKRVFTEIDYTISYESMAMVESNKVHDPATIISRGALAFAGSCALVTIYDQARRVLRVANAGDSRAVLGRWDASQNKYVAHEMSHDHTGFNPSEVERMAQEHPGEQVIDPKTGRTHGIAVTRAFGDSRWKWTEEVTKRAQELFWGPSPRPNGVIKTPPYLTAEPEIMEMKIQDSGEHPDFLIMASDGLWDNISNDNAVACVQMWLDNCGPTDFASKTAGEADPAEYVEDDRPQDTYWDPEEKATKWHVEPKHFSLLKENCGSHLIKNALGGNRTSLLRSVLTVKPPLSRNVRDDITVQVIFFGEFDEQAVLERAQANRANESERAAVELQGLPRTATGP